MTLPSAPLWVLQPSTVESLAVVLELGCFFLNGDAAQARTRVNMK